ncbi:MAG TPA: phosphatase PAP2 family protein [Ignavibacteriaceae bacterium]
MNFFRTFPLTALSIIIFYSLSFSQNSSDDPFNVDTDKEIIISATGAVIGAAAIVVSMNNDPLNINEINSLNPQDINAFDRIAIGPYQSDVLGDVLLYSSFIFPLTFLAYDKTLEDFGTVSLMYGEAVLLNASINALVKGLTLRNRPFVYDKNSLLEPKLDVGARWSFYSGHTSFTAVNTFYTAKVYSAYISSESTKTFLWIAAALIPAVTGFSRVNTHNHFPTDVIVGYIVGAAIGYFIPEIHKNKNGGTSNNTRAPQEFIHRPAFGFQISF